MTISPLALKICGVGAVVVPSVGLGIAYRNEISEVFRSYSLSDFDKGLMDFLNEGGDIQFKVKKGESDLTDLTFESASNSVKVSVKIDVPTASGSSSEGTLTESTKDGKGKKTALQALNNNKAWSWTCEFNFTKEANAPTTIETNQKKRIFDSTEKGFLGILKEAGNKDKKIKFISKCADKRGTTKNDEFRKDTTGTENKEIKGNAIELKMVKNGNSNDLVFKNKSDLDYWFPK